MLHWAPKQWAIHPYIYVLGNKPVQASNADVTVQPVRMQTTANKVELAVMHVFESEPSCADMAAMCDRNPLHTFMFDSHGKLLNANKAAFEAFQSIPPGIVRLCDILSRASCRLASPLYCMPIFVSCAGPLLGFGDCASALCMTHLSLLCLPRAVFWRVLLAGAVVASVYITACVAADPVSDRRITLKRLFDLGAYPG